MLGPKSDNKVTGSSNVTQAGGDIHGMTVLEHERMLTKALADLRSDLEAKFAESKRADKAERKVLEVESAELRNQIAELQKRLAYPEESYATYINRIQELETLLEETTVEFGENRIRDAEALLANGDESAADAIFAEVEAHDEVVETQARHRRAKAAYGRGLIAEGKVRWADAADHYARAAELVAELLHFLKAAEFAWRSGNFPSALRFGEKGIEMARELNDSRILGKALLAHAVSLEATARYSEAENLLTESLDICGGTEGKDSPQYAVRLSNLARVFQAKGHLKKAESHFQQALKITSNSLGEDNSAYAADLNNLATLYLSTGRFGEAENLFRQAIKIGARTYGEEHPDYAIDLNNLALLLLATGRFAEAQKTFLKVLEIDSVALGRKHPVYATHVGNLAVLYANQKRFDEALPLMEKALTIFEAVLGNSHPDVLKARLSLAAMRRDAGL